MSSTPTARAAGCRTRSSNTPCRAWSSRRSRCPAADAVKLGMDYTWDGRALQVTTLTTARYKGVEGELPFEYWGKEDVLFADLRGHDATFGTIDYSDGAPVLFIGRFVSFDELHLQNVRTFEAADRSKAMQGFNCANCGAAVELRALSQTRAVACTSCGAVIDARDRNVTILQTAAARQSISPLIPLGSRGEWAGQPHDVIGFQQRSVTVEGERYAWDEYVLFNPYVGFRYLTEYNGHWNDVTTVRELPVAGQRRGARGHAPRRRCSSRTSSTRPHAPTSSSASSRGACRSARRWPPTTTSSRPTCCRARAPTTSGPGRAAPTPTRGRSGRPSSCRARRPDADRRVRQPAQSLRREVAGALARLPLAGRARGRPAAVPDDHRGRARRSSREQFTLPAGRCRSRRSSRSPSTLASDGTVDVEITTSLSNSWLGFDLALINLETGDAHNIDTEVSYYSGVEGGESWSEGSTTATMVAAAPAGRAVLPARRARRSAQRPERAVQDPRAPRRARSTSRICWRWCC